MPNAGNLPGIERQVTIGYEFSFLKRLYPPGMLFILQTKRSEILSYRFAVGERLNRQGPFHARSIN